MVPVIGVIAYFWLVRRMKKEDVPEAPSIQLFWIFGTYGVLLILLLTSIMWKWSGMASLGAFAAILVGLVIMGITALTTYKNRLLSAYHTIAFWLSVAFFGIILVLIGTSILIN